MIRIAVIGNGNWGTAVAKVIASNTEKYLCFGDEVLLWVHEEMYQNQKLSEYINAFKSNPIYLSGVKLPDNIRAVTDRGEIEECDILVVCLPHQFIGTLADFKTKAGAFAVNMSKGVIVEDKRMYMPSEYISRILGIECCSLMGANIAHEVAQEMLSGCTVGYTKKEQAEVLEMMFENDYFRPRIIPYDRGIEICGGVKNIISLGFGLVDGMDCGSNTKAMVFLQGLIEIERLCSLIGAKFLALESCCVGDLLASSLSGRNFSCGHRMARECCTAEHVEKCMSGQKLQGPETAKSVHEWLQANKHDLSRFPLIEAVYRICYEGESAQHILHVLKKCITD